MGDYPRGWDLQKSSWLRRGRANSLGCSQLWPRLSEKLMGIFAHNRTHGQTTVALVSSSMVLTCWVCGKQARARGTEGTFSEVVSDALVFPGQQNFSLKIQNLSTSAPWCVLQVAHQRYQLCKDVLKCSSFLSMSIACSAARNCPCAWIIFKTITYTSYLGSDCSRWWTLACVMRHINKHVARIKNEMCYSCMHLCGCIHSPLYRDCNGRPLSQPSFRM